jgi:hypothetical protein
MWIEAAKTVTTLVQRRFLLNALLPSVILWVGLLAVFATGQGGFNAAIGFWNAQSQVLRVIEVVGFIAAVWLFAGLIASQWSTLVGLYSGEWPRLPTWLRGMLGTRWHRRRVRTLDKKVQEKAATTEDVDEFYFCYPEVDDPLDAKVASTRLGNIQRSAEVYFQRHYEADFESVWPRLYALLPESFLRMVEERRTALELTVVVSALSGFFGIVAGFYLILMHGTWYVFLAFFWGGLIVAALMNGLSKTRALNYAQTLRMAFDLHRHELRKQMFLSPPENFEQECQQWKKLNGFLREGDPTMPLSYVEEPPAALNGDRPALVVEFVNVERWA